MKLKVCGLSRSIEVETCVNNQVNYCGFILNYPKSHRFISQDRAKNLTEINKVNSKYVGVLVKPTEKELENFSKLNLDYFQLYGNYNVKDLLRIKKKFDKKIITIMLYKLLGFFSIPHLGYIFSKLNLFQHLHIFHT